MLRFQSMGDAKDHISTAITTDDFRRQSAMEFRQCLPQFLLGGIGIVHQRSDSTLNGMLHCFRHAERVDICRKVQPFGGTFRILIDISAMFRHKHTSCVRRVAAGPTPQFQL